jgi:hypothetical protein
MELYKHNHRITFFGANELREKREKIGLRKAAGAFSTNDISTSSYGFYNVSN